MRTAWGHDASGRLSTVSLNAVAKHFTYGYNAESGLLDTLDYPNTSKWRRTLEAVSYTHLFRFVHMLASGSAGTAYFDAEIFRADFYVCLLYTSRCV